MANFYAKYPASTGSTTAVTTVQGEGTAGTPVGGILTVQGDPSGTPIPVTGSISATNPSVAPTGAAVPADATYVGMTVSGNLTGLTGTANGLKVDGSAVTQPVSGTVAVSNFPATQPVSGTVAATQSGTWNIGTVSAVTAITNALPAGSNVIGHVIVDSGTVAATQSGTWNITNISGTVSLPTGAATETTLSAASAKLPATLGQKAMAASLAVAIASDQSAIPVTVATVNPATGRSSVLLYNNVNSSGNITTSAYTQVRAATGGAINLLYIADTSGSSFIIATGGAGVEVDQLYVGPGGNDAPYQLAIAASTRIAVKALSANMTTGALTITGLS